jgi:hypothetical protein
MGLLGDSEIDPRASSDTDSLGGPLGGHDAGRDLWVGDPDHLTETEAVTLEDLPDVLETQSDDVRHLDAGRPEADE